MKLFKYSLIAIISISLFSCVKDEDTTLPANNTPQTTPCSTIPSLTTFATTNITENSAFLSGIIMAPTCPNDSSVSSQGFVWSTNPLPEVTDNRILVSGDSVQNNLNGLAAETSYFVRTFLTNPSGTFYGNEVSFTTSIQKPIYLDANGITIKARSWAIIGDTASIGGILYTVTDSSLLKTKITNQEDITNLCVSRITNMRELFSNNYSFNQDISSWDVSNVTDMKKMFHQNRIFNQDIGSWNVSNVTDMSEMFEGNSAFNQNIGSWDISNVTDMRSMFSSASSFNQDISSWNVSNVTNMRYMFNQDSSFNQDLSSWNVSNVTVMVDMFRRAISFNQDISSWDVSNVTYMLGMFYGCLVIQPRHQLVECV